MLQLPLEEPPSKFYSYSSSTGKSSAPAHDATIVAIIMLHPFETLAIYGIHAKNELMLIAMAETARAAFDFLATGTIRAINMAYMQYP